MPLVICESQKETSARSPGPVCTHTLIFRAPPCVARSRAALSEYSKASSWFKSEDYSFSVRTVDVAAWIVRSFTESDYVLLKVDVEGAEFGFLPRLISLGGMPLIDGLSMECHHGVSEARKLRMNCAALESNVKRAAPKMMFMREGSLHKGLDRHSAAPPASVLQRWAEECKLAK